MNNLKNFHDFLNEGKHGRIEVWVKKKNGEEFIAG